MTTPINRNGKNKIGIKIEETSSSDDADIKVSLSQTKDFHMATIGGKQCMLTVWRKNDKGVVSKASLTEDDWKKRADQINTIYEATLKENANYQALTDKGFFINPHQHTITYAAANNSKDVTSLNVPVSNEPNNIYKTIFDDWIERLKEDLKKPLLNAPSTKVDAITPPKRKSPKNSHIGEKEEITNTSTAKSPDTDSSSQEDEIEIVKDDNENNFPSTDFLHKGDSNDSVVS